MLENYTPRTVITRPNPIFEREIDRSGLTLPPQLISGELAALAAVVQIAVAIIAPLLFRLFNHDIPQVVILLLSPLVLQLLVSLALDIYGAFNSVSVWQTSYQQEQWDAMRLTTLGEQDVVQAYYALAQARLWAATRFETSLRLILPGLMLLLGPVCIFPISLIVGLVALSDFGSLGSAVLFAALCGFMFSCGLVYVREPAWRLRLVTALGLWAATRIEGVAAMMLAGGAVLAVRLVWLVVIYGMYQGALWLAAAPVGNFAVGAVLGVYFGVLALLLIPTVRLLHDRLSRWLIAQTIHAVRRGE